MSSNPFHCAAPAFDKLCIVGAGGFGREVAWLAHQAWGNNVELVFAVDHPKYATGPVNGVPVVLLPDIAPTPGTRFVVAMGDPSLRRKAVAICEGVGITPAVLVHPRAEISNHVTLGDGCLVCAAVVITVDVVIARHVHINLACTVGHDVAIGEFSTLSPGVHVSGNVRIGRDAFIGTGASIINGQPGTPLVIGDGTVVAAGACVTRSVEAGAMVAGVPAVRKR